MKMNKSLLAGIFALAGAMVLTACGGGNTPAASSEEPAESTSQAPVESSSTAPVESSGEEPVVSSEEPASSSEDASSSQEIVYPTKVSIQQPGIVSVGTKLDARELITTTPANLETYSLTSLDEEVAIIEDGFIINVVGMGATKIKITVPRPNGKDKTLGNINITAMSEEARAVQEFADTVHNTFRADMLWGEVANKSVAELTGEEDVEFDFGTLVVNPNYVLDWVYGSYSALKLQADGNCYDYTVVDEAGDEVPGENDTSAAQALSRAAGVVVGSRVQEVILTDYFPIDSLLKMTDWGQDVTDGGDVYFTLDDPDLVASQLGNIYSMVSSSFKNGSATLTFDEESEVLNFCFLFDQDEKAQIVFVTLTAGEAAKIPVLDAASEGGDIPEPLDVTDLAAEFALYENNFVSNWEIGLFDRQTLEPISGEFAANAGLTSNINSVGTSIVNDGITAHCSMERSIETGEILEDTLAYGGWTVDTENGGVYELEEGTDEDAGMIVKADSPINGSASITTFNEAREHLGYLTNYLTKDVLEGASLNFDEATGTYTYNATFDDCYLSGILASLCPFGYDDDSGLNIFANPDNANYIECMFMVDFENHHVIIFLAERIRLDEEAKYIAYEGLTIELSQPGTAPVIAVGGGFDALFNMGAEPQPE